LPPVPNSNAQVKFAFEAGCWNETIKKTFNLTQVFRQTDQGKVENHSCYMELTKIADFVNMLNEMRFGMLTQTSINKFKSLSREIRYEDGIGATEL
jgi:ATP-dependent DNA helicase PIF1